MKKHNFLILLTLVSSAVLAQKPITLSEAQNQLQKNNLLLLAEEYNISISKAALIQSKIWEQPYISGEINAINPQDKRVFDIAGRGQKGLAVQQLIYLGGKKKNEVAFAKSNIEIAELEFEQLLRNLKFQLGQNFYEVFYNNEKKNAIDTQLETLETLLTLYEKQVANNNISLKEVVRLQSLILNLKNEKNTLISNNIAAQQIISILTGSLETFMPKVNEIELLAKLKSSLISKNQILDETFQNSVEYNISKKLSESRELQLLWQKSLAKPDLTAGLSYDQRSGAFQNQVNITFGLPIPLWNKNKGNIKIAEAQKQQALVNIDFKKLELQSKVEAYWEQWKTNQNLYNGLSISAANNLETVYNGVLTNFQKRNISMLEFTDFMESYNESTIQINEIKKAWIISSLNLNYITNTEIF